jgi:triosephosphate isomerase
LATIICIGETAAERRDGNTLSVCNDQLAGSLPDMPNGARTAIAFEPLWAIGSGIMPPRDDIVAVLAHMRAALD